MTAVSRPSMAASILKRHDINRVATDRQRAMPCYSALGSALWRNLIAVIISLAESLATYCCNRHFFGRSSQSSSSSFAKRICSGLSPLNPSRSLFAFAIELLVISFPTKRLRHVFSTSRSSNTHLPIRPTGCFGGPLNKIPGRPLQLFPLHYAGERHPMR